MSNYHWGFGIEHEFSVTYSKKIIISLNDLLNYFNNIGNKELVNKIEKTFQIKMIISPISEIKKELSVAKEKQLITEINGRIKPTILGQRYLTELLQIFLRG